LEVAHCIARIKYNKKLIEVAAIAADLLSNLNFPISFNNHKVNFGEYE